VKGGRGITAWRVSATAVVTLAVMVLSGCSSGSSVNNHPTMTQQQAANRVEHVLQSTAAVLTPRPHLELNQPLSVVGPCLDPADGGSENRVIVPRSYWLRGISPQDNASIGMQVLDFWKKQGYLIAHTHGVGTDQPDITGRTRPDDFLISLEWSADGSLSIGATSPCIWPKGTPPPS
jgi:hypothetical protein